MNFKKMLSQLRGMKPPTREQMVQIRTNAMMQPNPTINEGTNQPPSFNNVQNTAGGGRLQGGGTPNLQGSVGKPLTGTISSQAALNKALKAQPTPSAPPVKPKFSQDDFIRSGGLNTSKNGIIRKSTRKK